MTPPRQSSLFTRFARWTSHAAGRSMAFALAVMVIAVWAATGPVFRYSDTWQLVINTGTTIVTFLMVFLIQNTQNRDSEAMHLKLDELIRAVRSASNELLDLEECDEAELTRIHQRYARLASEARERLEQRASRPSSREPQGR